MSQLIGPADSLRVLGLSHHTAPVELRERLAFRADDLPKALAGLKANGCREAVILSTCNRVEVITVARDGIADISANVKAFLAEFHSVPVHEFHEKLYEYRGIDAARHLFEVAASLDSQILGETEILSQTKDAYRIAGEAGSAGPLMHKLFERSFFLSKELRSDGGIGRSQASVSSAAVTLATRVFEIKNRKVLVVGTGEMATGIVRSLRAAGAGDVFVASRTEQRAIEFAQREGAKPCNMHNLNEYIENVDIVLVSAAAPHYVIGPAQIKHALPKRRGRDLCLIDISVPRNVDPEVANVADNIYLFDIDDLEDVAKEGRREREAVAARWRPKLAEEARELLREMQDRTAHDAARLLIEHVEQIRRTVLEQLRTNGSDPKAAAERALELFQGKLLHGPLESLRQAAREGDGTETTAWVWRLFRMEVPAPFAAPEQKPDTTQNDGVLRTDVSPISMTPAVPPGENRKDVLDGRKERPLLNDSGATPQTI